MQERISGSNHLKAPSASKNHVQYKASCSRMQVLFYQCCYYLFYMSLETNIVNQNEQIFQHFMGIVGVSKTQKGQIMFYFSSGVQSIL